MFKNKSLSLEIQYCLLVCVYGQYCLDHKWQTRRLPASGRVLGTGLEYIFFLFLILAKAILWYRNFGCFYLDLNDHNTACPRSRCEREKSRVHTFPTLHRYILMLSHVGLLINLNHRVFLSSKLRGSSFDPRP